MEGTIELPQTEQAMRAFLERVEQIAGVVGTKRLVGKTATEQSVIVFVPTLLSETSEQVIDLRTKIHRTYPDARLDVSIKGLRERGFDPATITPSELAEL